jgi:peptide/nickel transport system ATP-binding protein
MPVRDTSNSTKANPLLIIENLKTQYFSDEGFVQAVNGISYTLNEGECLGVVGESGCGKSAHARSIMGLINPAAGKVTADKIWFNGHDMLNLSPAEIRKIRGSEMAMVFQDPMSSLNPVLKIGDQLSEGLELHLGMDEKSAHKRCVELMELVRIPDAASRLDDYPHQFSGGMRQRVMIAMALSCNPKLLIADEPTTALDVTIQAQIMNLVTEIQKEIGMAIMWITHDLGVVAGLARTVNVMYAGSIIERGGVNEIYSRPLHPYTYGLLGSLPHVGKHTKELASIPGTPPNLFALPAGCPFADRCTFVQDICRQHKPDLEYTGDTEHQVSCFLWPEIEKQRNAHPAAAPEEADAAETPVKANQPLLKVENLKTYFPINKGVIRRHVGDVKAVDGVSFEIYAGETLGLVGESGSGKTTIGRSIIRLIEPTSGKVFFKDREITTISAREMRALRPRVQIIFQNPYASLNPRLNVETIVSAPLTVHRKGNRNERRQKTKELMKLVGLSPAFLNRYPHEFSGGQQQRIGIARALALNPDLIICDEPIASLDVSIQAQIVNLLKRLQRQLGIAYLFIAHDLSMVHYISDRIAVMYLGKMMELAEKDELFANPVHPYTRYLLSAIPVPDPKVERNRKLLTTRGDEIPSVANPPKGCNFNTRCPFAEQQCFDEKPEFKEIAPGHFCSCHFAQKFITK